MAATASAKGVVKLGVASFEQHGQGVRRLPVAADRLFKPFGDEGFIPGLG